MKDQILKIAGVKSEKEFYRLFPDESSFMAKHGKEFKKAMRGAKLNKAQNGLNQTALNDINQGIGIAKFQGFDQYGTTESSDVNPYMLQTPQLTGDPSYGKSVQPAFPTAPKNKKGIDVAAGITKGIPIAGKIIGGIQKLKDEREALKSAQQWKGVSDIALQASGTRPEEIQRKYVRPEDIQNTGEEFFPVYGVGTNPLAQNGKIIPKAQLGAAIGNFGKQFVKQGGGEALGQFTQGLYGENAGAQIGQGVGDALKMIPGIGPVAGALAAPVLGGIGALLDRNPRRTERANEATYANVNKMAFQGAGRGLQGQYTSYMEQGGDIPNPQLVRSIQGMTAEDYNRFANMRTGGSLRSNMQNEGELQMYEGGAAPISYNPNLPGDGETVMFNGNSHSDGGQDISFGGNPVEVEGGEPAVKLQDGDGNENLTVFGNLTIPKGYLGDPDAHGKFKNYITKLSKKETSQNKLTEESVTKIGDMKIQTPFDKLKFTSLKMNAMGASMKLKDIAEKKKDAAALQDAINQTADEHGLMAEHLSKGEIKKAKYGTAIKAQNGTTTDETTLNPWITGINAMIPYLRPSDREALDPNQLAGEMYALSSNQVEPVQAQTYRPQLSTPYDVSLQDILNEQQAASRAAQRTIGYNPAAQAAIAGQMYGANQKILGEQFRMNQAQKAGVYDKNVGAMNEAQLKNLGILDTQYGRQAEAKSNTKALNQAAISSIADKFQKNKLEQMQLATYENMYNYRFDDRGRAWNWNPLAQFNTTMGDKLGKSTVLPEGYEYIYDKNNQPIDVRKTPQTKTTPSSKKNGGIVRAIKNL